MQKFLRVDFALFSPQKARDSAEFFAESCAIWWLKSTRLCRIFCGSTSHFLVLKKHQTLHNFLQSSVLFWGLKSTELCRIFCGSTFVPFSPRIAQDSAEFFAGVLCYLRTKSTGLCRKQQISTASAVFPSRGSTEFLSSQFLGCRRLSLIPPLF